MEGVSNFCIFKNDFKATAGFSSWPIRSLDGVDRV